MYEGSQALQHTQCLFLSRPLTQAQRTKGLLSNFTLKCIAYTHDNMGTCTYRNATVNYPMSSLKGLNCKTAFC